MRIEICPVYKSCNPDVHAHVVALSPLGPTVLQRRDAIQFRFVCPTDADACLALLSYLCSCGPRPRAHGRVARADAPVLAPRSRRSCYGAHDCLRKSHHESYCKVLL